MAKALNIVGENHKEYVSNQIATRQRVLNELKRSEIEGVVDFNYRDSTNLNYINSRTAFIRVASSVDIEDQLIYKNVLINDETKLNGGAEFRSKILGFGGDAIYGNWFASNLILFGGASTTSNILRYKINNLESTPLNEPELISGYQGNFYQTSFGVSEQTSDSIFNYGYGGTEFGLVPAPGIQNFRTSNLNKGALRISTINLRANNRRQFEWIEALYLRLGYSIFIEWGDSSYYKTIKANKNGNNSLPSEEYIFGVDASNSLLDTFMKAKIKDEVETDHFITNFYKEIEKLREESEGNYDAILGRVRNYNWEFTSEGYYNITIEVVSYGDVVESLKINNFTYNLNLQQFPENQRNEVRSDLEAFIMTAGDFYPFVQNPNSSPGSWRYDRFIKNYPSLKSNNLPQDQKEVVDRLSNYTRPKREWGKAIALQASIVESVAIPLQSFSSYQDYENYVLTAATLPISATSKVYQYIRLKDILDFINERCLLYDKEGKKIIKIEIPDETPDDNGNPKEQCIGYSNQYQISADPSRVLVAAKFALNLNTSETAFVDCFGKGGPLTPNEGAEPFHALDSDNNPYCNILNIYYSTEYLKSLFPQDEDVYLYSFIQQLLDTANSCLGGVNRFTARLSEENTLQIYDESRPVATKTFIKNEPSTALNIYGLKSYTSNLPNPADSTKPLKVNNKEGSFVRKFNITSQLDKNFSTLISVGAQANGYAVGEDATFLSRWNIGLVDRIVPDKLDWRDNYQSAILRKIQFRDAVVKYFDFIKNYHLMFAIFGNYSGNNIPVLPLVSSFKGFTKTQKDIFRWYSSLASSQSTNEAADSGATNTQPYINPTIGFLPINLGIEMDGISGMRIFDKLTVDTSFLPYGYDDTLDFIIKTLEHRVGLDNRWITTLETFVVPKFKNTIQAPGLYGFEKIVSSELDDLPPIDGTPSFFTIDTSRPVLKDILGTTLTGRSKKYGLPKDTFGKDTGYESLSEFVNIVNKSTAPHFRKFFEAILNDPRTATNFKFVITTAYRPIGYNIRLGGKQDSSHLFGLAIDLNIYKLNTSTNTYEVYATNEPITQTTYRQRYTQLGLPDHAKLNYIGWGTNYKISSSTIWDNVHFAMDGQNATYTAWRDDTLAKDEYQTGGGGSWRGNVARPQIINWLNEYIPKNSLPLPGMDKNKASYTWTNMLARITTLNKTASTDIYYNRINTKDFLKVTPTRTKYDSKTKKWVPLTSGFTLRYEPMEDEITSSSSPKTLLKTAGGNPSPNQVIPKILNSKYPETQLTNTLGIPGL